MKISGFRLERIHDRVRASAQMLWEDSERDDATLFFETEDHGRDGFSSNPHAFLLACTVPAIHYGERRIYLDADLCPVLKEGLGTAASIIHEWYYRDKRMPIAIEAKAVMRGLPARSRDRAGFFFSGGIDSYATLRLNRMAFPAEHPYSIRDGILVFGLEQDDPDKFEYVKEYLSHAADACGVSLIPIYTNIYLVYREEDARNRFRFWEYEYEGSAFASIAHSLADRLSAVSISGTLSPRALSPYGSHPVLDPHYSSGEMKINHAGIALSRLAKAQLVAEWGLPLRYLRVCNQYKRYGRGALNCGECEKCIRTKLAFLVLGQLPGLDAFATKEITVELVERRIRINTEYKQACYAELLNPLVRAGHRHIASSIERKLKEYHRHSGTAQEQAASLHRRILRRLLGHFGASR